MNQTLQKLREIAQESVLSTQDTELKGKHSVASRAQLAAPLIRAFRDVEKEYVRISVLRQIWPDDYDRRDDRVLGLLIMMFGPESAPYGLKMAMPRGFLSFEVTLKSDGSPVFSCIRDTDGQRPLAMDFPDGKGWLEYFYKVIADVIEL
jgi:predicted type IV restriction endonuclease